MEDEDNRKRRASPDSVVLPGVAVGDVVDVKPDLGTLRKRLRSDAAILSNDVEVVERAPAVVYTSREGGETNDDDEIQLVGTVNEQKLPHMRPHCLEHVYQSSTGIHQNQRFCDLCYCYVCDVKASDCEEWNTHCLATDQGPRASYWRNQRALSKNTPAQATDTATQLAMIQEAMYRPKPNTVCRHCDWKGHLDLNANNAGVYDWCQDCGRVASKSALGKVQSEEQFIPTNGILLGAKTIPFRLHTRDPRTMDSYELKWEENQWEYNPKDMEEEVFQHRFGERPSLEMIFSSIPILQEDMLPKDGRSRFLFTGGNHWADERASLTELDSLLIEERNHRLILIFLRILQEKTSRLTASITASWDRETSTGKFDLEVHVRETPSSQGEPLAFTAFLGAWFGIFPFSLSDISGTLVAETHPQMVPDRPDRQFVPFPPFILSVERCDELRKEQSFQDMTNAYFKDLEAAANARKNQQSITASIFTSGTGGVSCTHATDLEGTLRRYYQEILPCLSGARPFEKARWHFSESLGVVSRHRSMQKTRRDFVHLERISEMETLCLDSFLTPHETSVAETMLEKSSKQLLVNREPLKDFMKRMENLGHKASPFIEGLNVELLPFQQQTVQWAAERETTPGGVQTYTWARLPSVAQANTELYYNPGIRQLTTCKPKLVRGGIIADEMGLGKTVVSLALILRNPAPSLFESGSASSLISEATSQQRSGAFWDRDLAGQTQATNKNRGSILSRGTLVVCTVSLVGQWIEEAKSKLKDPGLVYSYHGSGRSRDPQLLARNSIVVTTYETLQSDRAYHQKRSKDPEYCAPCEQVRWWRIICDESHILRNRTKKSLAAIELVGDNRWLVTGTPMNTNAFDMKNQLAFLGMQDAYPILSVQDLGRNSSQARIPGNVHRQSSLFLMRPIMMRQQTYRGTTTTLMSLPPKTERVVEVCLSDADKAEYSKMETGARDAYKNLKLLTDKIGTQFLKLTQILLPLRVACAGGKTPLPSDSAPVEDDSDNEDEEGAGKKKHKKRIVKFSDYAFQSKLKTLIEELKRVREEDSTAKSLVFSQFGSTLKWIQEELPKHGFQFRTLSGDMPMRKRAKALLDFQNDPPTTVFLLSMRAGAVGINLTQANRVFLLEPCFNPALELQAIGRVHRLGQQRSVEIIRLVMQDSVESRMVEMLEKKHGKASTSDESDDDAVGTAPLVGNLQTDKVDMVEEELDLLFGVASGAEDLKTTTDLDGFKEEEAACTGGDEGSGVFAML